MMRYSQGQKLSVVWLAAGIELHYVIVGVTLLSSSLTYRLLVHSPSSSLSTNVVLPTNTMMLQTMQQKQLVSSEGQGQMIIRVHYVPMILGSLKEEQLLYVFV